MYFQKRKVQSFSKAIKLYWNINWILEISVYNQSMCNQNYDQVFHMFTKITVLKDDIIFVPFLIANEIILKLMIVMLNTVLSLVNQN